MATMTGAAARRERGRQEMREQILGAARRIVQEKGIEALTMRAVAGAIGYSPAALYEYFPAKEDLYECLYFEGAGGLNGRMQAALASLPPGATARERLTALGHAYRAFAHEQTDLFRLIFVGPVPDSNPDGPVAAHDPKDGFNLLVDVCRQGVESGDLAPVPPLVLALAAWGCVHGFVMLEIAGHLTGYSPPAQAIHGAGPVPGPPPSLDDLFAATVELSGYGFLRR